MTYKFQQIKPQKARGRLHEEMWADLDWIAEEKYDGDRRIAQFCENKVRLTGTRESVDGTGYVEKSDNIPQISDYHAPKQCGLAGTVLDGEIIYTGRTRGGKSKYVTSVMGSKPEEAIRKQKESGWLEYVVFDCLFFKGSDVRDLPLRERRNRMEYVLRQWENRYTRPSDHVAGSGKRLYYDSIIKNGGEGVILKHRSHTYGDEKLWIKVKGEWTADVVIMGFEPGKGKYEGQVGAIKFGQHRAISLKAGARNVVGLSLMGTCSGFDDDLRHRLTVNGPSFIGQVIEIAHNGREPTGAFRHPRFKRFRPDKSPKDCVYREDET